jgi:hypothetical protein
MAARAQVASVPSRERTRGSANGPPSSTATRAGCVHVGPVAVGPSPEVLGWLGRLGCFQIGVVHRFFPFSRDFFQ